MSIITNKLKYIVASGLILTYPMALPISVSSCSSVIDAECDLSCLGDSLTWFSEYNIYVKQELNLSSTYNYGIGHSSIGWGCVDPFCFRYQNLPRKSKIIIVDGGYNDAFHGPGLGLPNDTTPFTFYGALNILMPGLKKQYPNAWIFFMTPFYYSDSVETLEPFCGAIVNKCIEYNIDCFNIFTPSFPFDYKTDTFDGIHPTQKFTKNVWAPAIAQFIRSHYLQQ